MFSRLVTRTARRGPAALPTRQFATGWARLPDSMLERRPSRLAHHEVNLIFKDLDVKKRYKDHFFGESMGPALASGDFIEASLSEHVDDELKAVVRCYAFPKHDVDKYLPDFSEKIRAATYEKFSEEDVQCEFRPVLVETDRLSRGLDWESLWETDYHQGLSDLK